MLMNLTIFAEASLAEIKLAKGTMVNSFIVISMSYLAVKVTAFATRESSAVTAEPSVL